jgi:hypothetical protein
MEDQRLAEAPTDSLPDTVRAHQICCNGGVFTLGYIPGRHLASPVVNHQVEIQ